MTDMSTGIPDFNDCQLTGMLHFLTLKAADATVKRHRIC
jgi:hypothetical protein